MINQNIGMVEYVVQLARLNDELELQVHMAYRIADDELEEADWMDDPNSGYLVVSVLGEVGMFPDYLEMDYERDLKMRKVAEAGYELLKKQSIGDVLAMRGQQLVRVFAKYQVTAVSDHEGDWDLSVRLIECLDSNMCAIKKGPAFAQLKQEEKELGNVYFQFNDDDPVKCMNDVPGELSIEILVPPPRGQHPGGIYVDYNMLSAIQFQDSKGNTFKLYVKNKKDDTGEAGS